MRGISFPEKQLIMKHTAWNGLCIGSMYKYLIINQNLIIMKKLFVMTCLLAGTLLLSCRATVKTPITNTDIKIGTTK